VLCDVGLAEVADSQIKNARRIVFRDSQELGNRPTRLFWIGCFGDGLDHLLATLGCEDGGLKNRQAQPHPSLFFTRR